MDVEVFNFSAGVADDLQRAGLLVRSPKAPGRFSVVDPALSLFVPLLRAFDVKLVPVLRNDCPVRFCTAILNLRSDELGEGGNREPGIPAGGQGTTSASAALGCLGELAERLSLCTQGDSDERILVREQAQSEVAFSDATGLSRMQEKRLFARLQPQTVETANGDISWERISDRRVVLRSLTGKGEALCPSFAVLFGEMERLTGSAVSPASSSGCAVWSDLAGARQRALLELVERDAVAQAWYNRLGITRVETALVREILPPELVYFLQQRPRRWSLHVVQTDLPVWVVMAFSYEGGGRQTAFGASAGWTVSSACESAVREMLQAEFSLELMAVAYPDRPEVVQRREQMPRQLAFARQQSIFDHLPINDTVPRGVLDLTREYSSGNLMQQCMDRGFDIWEFEATRADLNIPCVKLLSPDLCCWEPRFGKRRLFEGVVERGLRSGPATEAEFAARPFPF